MNEASFVKSNCKGRLSKVFIIENGLFLKAWAWINVQQSYEEWVGGGSWAYCRQQNCRLLHGLLKKKPVYEDSGEHKAEAGSTTVLSSVSASNSELLSACNVLIIQNFIKFQQT